MQPGLALRALAVIIVMLTATTARADDSGYCGDPNMHGGQDVSWALTDEDGDNVKETLTISGTGAMVAKVGAVIWATTFSRLAAQFASVTGSTFTTGCKRQQHAERKQDSQCFFHYSSSWVFLITIFAPLAAVVLW